MFILLYLTKRVICYKIILALPIYIHVYSIVFNCIPFISELLSISILSKRDEIITNRIRIGARSRWKTTN